MCAKDNCHYERPMAKDAKRRARMELEMLGSDLAEVMHLHGARSAMVRVWIDPRGRTMLAANLYNRSANVPSDGNPSLAFREEVKA